MQQLKEVTIYTDGGSIGNPGPGAYGVVLIYGDNRRELSQGFRLTTNNRMEIMAAITALKTLNYRCKVTLYSDSKYLVDAMNLGWVEMWRARDWKRAKNKILKNIDLWHTLLTLCDFHQVKFVWIQGHSGIKDNELCDMLIKEAVKRDDLKIDVEYEKTHFKNKE